MVEIATRVFEHLERGWVEVAQAAVELEHREQRTGVLDERAVQHGSRCGASNGATRRPESRGGLGASRGSVIDQPPEI